MRQHALFATNRQNLSNTVFPIKRKYMVKVESKEKVKIKLLNSEMMIGPTI